jgi:hypothetical protein
LVDSGADVSRDVVRESINERVGESSQLAAHPPALIQKTVDGKKR